MIAVITYDHPTRKTQELLFRLKALGYDDVVVFATPFIQRKNFTPMYQHRPANAINLLSRLLCKRLNYHFKIIETIDLAHQFSVQKFDAILIGGAGILPEKLVLNHCIINAHPAFLPFSRGLDALKWSIVEDNPIGVTTHFIDNQTDAGLLIDQKKVVIYSNDTFHNVAYRQFELEIEMLVEAIEIIKTKTSFETIKALNTVVNKRMPKEIEQNLLLDFEKYKNKHHI